MLILIYFRAGIDMMAGGQVLKQYFQKLNTAKNQNKVAGNAIVLLRGRAIEIYKGKRFNLLKLISHRVVF